MTLTSELASPLDRPSDALSLLRAAIERTESRLDAMAAALGPDQCPCCVGAAYGGTDGPYDRLRRKLNRQEAWLAVVIARRRGDARELARASRVYAALAADEGHRRAERLRNRRSGQ